MTGHHDLLASVPLFSRLPRETIDDLARGAVERQYAPGVEIVTEGESGIGFFLIVDGTAEVLHGHDGAPVSTLGPGAYFGEMALVDGQRRSATVRAATPLTCLALTRWDFLAVVRSDADLAVELLEQMSRRVRAAEARIAELEGRGGA